MRSLRPLWTLWLRTYYRWAAREVNPTHPDAGYIALRLAELETR